MRTTLDLPEVLIDEAMRISGAKTKSQLIISALEELIKKEERMKLLTFKGKIDLDIDLDITRGRQ
jgi:Arc/MetJ family transcription regulator